MRGSYTNDICDFRARTEAFDVGATVVSGRLSDCCATCNSNQVQVNWLFYDKARLDNAGPDRRMCFPPLQAMLVSRAGGPVRKRPIVEI